MEGVEARTIERINNAQINNVFVAADRFAEFVGHSRTPSIGERNMIAMATACAKLEHAFHSAIETYYRVKRGVTQIVRVERVEVQPGAQAVIGIVARE